jgi:hypothetical protein
MSEAGERADGSDDTKLQFLGKGIDKLVVRKGRYAVR